MDHYLGLFNTPSIYALTDDMARAFSVSNEEMDKIIKESRQELIEAGEDSDDYFREVKSTRFMM